MCVRRWPHRDRWLSLGLATSVSRPFPGCTICSSIPLLSKIHLLISCNYCFVFIFLFRAATRVAKKESRFTCRLDHRFSFRQTRSVFPHGGQAGASPWQERHPTPLFLDGVIGMTVRGFTFSCSPRAACFFREVLIISVLSLSSRRERMGRLCICSVMSGSWHPPTGCSSETCHAMSLELLKFYGSQA